MRKVLLLLVFALVSGSALLAADPQEVMYKSGAEQVKAVSYMPTGEGPFPALIVIHEWYGLNDWVKQQASDLADQGYVTLAIDLYRGKLATSSDEAHELMRGLPEDRAARDLRAAFEYLEAQKSVNPKRIGSIGWCMGGGYSLETALVQPRLAATVINYGRLVTDPASLKKITAPVLGIFGGKDRGIPVESVKAFESELKKLGKKVEIHIYPDAGHAFQNEHNKAGYRPEDAKDSRAKTLAFLQSTLKK